MEEVEVNWGSVCVRALPSSLARCLAASEEMMFAQHFAAWPCCSHLGNQGHTPALKHCLEELCPNEAPFRQRGRRSSFELDSEEEEKINKANTIGNQKQEQKTGGSEIGLRSVEAGSALTKKERIF